jgi:hypothetical protein
MMDRTRHTTIVGVATVRLATGPRAAVETVARGGQGVLFRVVPEGADGETAFEVALVFGEGEPEIQLRYTSDDELVIAEWRTLAAQLGQPLLIEMPDRTVIEARQQVGLVQLGALHLRRRCAAITKRRPRFLCRRKASRLPERPVMVRGVDFQTVS